MMKRAIPCLLEVLFMGGLAFGQQPAAAKPVESHKYRTALTLAGAGGGFVAGIYIGFNAYDDAVNSDRKVWTTALITAGGGAAGGYFIGRALDKRRRKTALIETPQSTAQPSLTISPVLSGDTKALAFVYRF